MSATPAVEISGCAFSYGRARALDGVSFRVPPGSIFGLLGPNGSGKTTLFRILATLLVPDRGSARLFGIDIAENPIKARRQLGIVFQSQSLDRRLSVEENLVHQGHMYGMRGATLASRIRDVLGKVGLADRQKDRVETLSGGLRRRADLAKGLLHAPKLLLLDEPSTGVDPGARLSFWQHLEDLRRSDGVTVLLTTHLLNEADRCDRLAILDRGRLIREGPPGQLKAEIGADVVTLATSVPSEVAAVLSDEFGVVDARVNGRQIRFEHAEGSKWTARMMERFGERIESVKVARPSLEDVFLHHAGHGFDTEGKSWAETPHATS
jgi:ABC-2 type transport system ATP-binding protein